MGAERALLCAALLAQARLLGAQDTGPVHDAPYIPSPQITVEEMLRLAQVGPGDVVYDLGSGDGRVVITAAAQFGARGVGVERDAVLVAQSRINAERAGVAARVRFLQQDLFATGLAEATVVTLYLSPNLNLRLRPALLALAPGTRIVSHSADLGDWPPDRKTSIRKDVLLWIVPARVAGRWRAEFGSRRLDLDILQRYQGISMQVGGAATQAWEARLEGERLSFVLVEKETAFYVDARVRGDLLEGLVRRGATGPREAFSAKRGQ